MKLLLTGATGLLGSALKIQAMEFFDVISPTRKELNLEDAIEVNCFIQEHRPTYCIHSAANVYGLGGHKLHPNKALFLNSKIDLNLISALSEVDIEHFVYVGTVASYGFPYKVQPLIEQHFLAGVPHAGEYGYAMAKRFGFDLSNSLKLKGTTVTYAIMTNMFGPNDNFNEKTGHVIPSLIARAFQAKDEGKFLQVWGQPTDTRDFLHSHVAATRILQTLSIKFDGLINIGSGIERKILDVAELIKDIVGVAGIEQKEGGVNAIHKRTLDISLLERNFGVVLDDFEGNLQRTIEWYARNRAYVRK